MTLIVREVPRIIAVRIRVRIPGLCTDRQTREVCRKDRVQRLGPYTVEPMPPVRNPHRVPSIFPAGRQVLSSRPAHNRRRTHMGRPRMELVPRAALHMVQEFHKTPPGRTRADMAIRRRLRFRHEQDRY